GATSAAPGMLWTIRSITSLLLSFGLLLLANGLFGTLLGLRSKLEGFSTEITGLVMAGYSLGLLLGAFYAVRVVASVGHIRAFAAFASIMSVAVLTHLLIIEPITWLCLRMVAGFCMAGMVMVTESWINERASNATRGRILSLYMVTNYIGSGSGQLLLNIANPEQFELFVVASIIFSIALVPVLLTRTTGPKPVTPQRMSLGQLYVISPVGVIGTIAAGSANASVNSLGAIFASDQNLSLAEVSMFMACIIMGGMLLQFPLGRMSDRFDRRTTLLLSAVATAACSLGLMWAARDAGWPLFVIAAVYGGFAFTIYPLCCAQVNDLADPDRLVQVSAGLLVAFGLGAIVGPIVSGLLMGYFGANGLFFFTTTVSGSLALFTVYRMAIRTRSVRQKAPYLPLGSIGVSSKQLYAAVVKSIHGQR
ncbi:MAG: MFS transporter, partial [Hyphomicrobiaceae bacterium]